MAKLPHKQIHVAVALIVDGPNILIAKRLDHLHQGGKWEFPGGKVESDEDVLAAVKRECLEEVGVKVITAKPFIQVPFTYPEKSVLLDTWLVEQFSGEPNGRELQEVKWEKIIKLGDYDFPEPNKVIVERLITTD